MDRVFPPAVEELAASQHGIVARRQLLEIGVTHGIIDRRVRSGSLVRVDRGVFRLRTARQSYDQQLMTAIVGVGPSTVVSHQSAAHMWELMDRRPELPHVTTSAGRWRSKAFNVHRSGDLAPEHVDAIRGIPVTIPSRTVVDLGATVSAKAVAVIFGRVLRDGMVTLREFECLLADIGRQGRAGVGVARKLVEERREWDGDNESVLEDEFRRLVSRAGLPSPVGQFEIRDHSGLFVGRADFAFPEQRLAIELDGYRYHSDPETFVRDRNRQNRLLLAGYRVLRYTARDLRQTPERVVADLVRSLT
jgi:hypothetical protein